MFYGTIPIQITIHINHLGNKIEVLRHISILMSCNVLGMQFWNNTLVGQCSVWACMCVCNVCLTLCVPDAVFAVSKKYWKGSVCVNVYVCVCQCVCAYVRVHIHVCRYWMRTQWAYKDKEFFWRQCVLVMMYLIFLRPCGLRDECIFIHKVEKVQRLKKCNAFFKSSYVQVATKIGPHINNRFSQNDNFLV